MRRALLVGIGALWVATGVAIFIDPRTFYDHTPGLALMGPFSVHFIRDVGLALLAAGLVTAIGARRGHRELCLAGVSWPVFHALFHIQIWWHRGFPLDGIAAFDVGAVIAPAFVAAALAWQIGLGTSATRMGTTG